MGLLTKLFGTKKVPQTSDAVTKSMSSSDASYFFGDGSDNDSPFNELTTEEQLQVMHNNTLVYACVSTKATAFQQARLTVQLKTDKGWIDQPEHPYLQPFKSNPWLTESDMLQYEQLHINLTGKSFLWKWYNKAGDLSEMWPVPPHWVQFVVPDTADQRNRVVTGYLIDPKENGVEPLYVPLSDMCYTRYPDPLNLYDGLSPVAAASNPIQLDTKGELYRGESMDAFSLPGIAVRIKDPHVSQDQKDDIRSVLRQKMGKDARKNALILNGADVVVDVLNPLEKFDWKTYSNLNESRICMAFRVSPIVIGAQVGLDNSSLANIDSAQSFFYNNTMTAEWDLAERSFNKWLIPSEEKDTVRYAFDTSVVPQMQADAADTEKRAVDLFNSSVITLNEAREMTGFPAVPNGNVVKINAATIFPRIGETVGVPAYELRDPDNNPDEGADIFGDQDNDTSEEVDASVPNPSDSVAGLQ